MNLTTTADETRASGRPGAAPPESPDRLAVLHAMADPTRWRILQCLVDAELCTTHLQELLDAKQPVLSHHLRVLREAGLVTTEPCGRFTYYRLRPGALSGLMDDVLRLAEAGHRATERRAC